MSSCNNGSTDLTTKNRTVVLSYSLVVNFDSSTPPFWLLVCRRERKTDIESVLHFQKYTYLLSCFLKRLMRISIPPTANDLPHFTHPIYSADLEPWWLTWWSVFPMCSVWVLDVVSCFQWCSQHVIPSLSTCQVPRNRGNNPDISCFPLLIP